MFFAGKYYAAAAFAGYDVAGSSKARTAIAPVVAYGDTARDAEGNLLDAIDPIDEEVAFFLTTRVGSFFGRQAIGNGVFRVRVHTNSSEVSVRDNVRRALTPMTDSGQIANVTVTPNIVDRNGTAINFFDVSYRKTNLLRR